MRLTSSTACEAGQHGECSGRQDDPMFNESFQCWCTCHAGALRRLVQTLAAPGRGKP